MSPPPCPQASTQPSFVSLPCAPAPLGCSQHHFGVRSMRCPESPPWAGRWLRGLAAVTRSPWGSVRPPHTDIHPHTAARAGDICCEPRIISMGIPADFPPCLSKARRRLCGCVSSACYQAVQPWLSPPVAPGGPKPIPSSCVQVGLARSAQGGRREGSPREDPERGLGICPASPKLT